MSGGLNQRSGLQRALRWALWLSIAAFVAGCAGPSPSAALPQAVLPSPTPVPSSTRVPPSPTLEQSPTPAPPTSTPTPTATPVPPTATATPVPVPPTSTPTAVAAPEANQTIYVFPVRSDGKVSYGAEHHDYPATDIFCPIGSAFVAPTAGVVEWVSTEDLWDPATDNPADRGGISVAMVGDDGVRYYGSHLSAVAEGMAVGMRVAAGQLLGLTGNSGNARSTPPHLHFGISHPTTPNDWQTRRGEIAPYPYLRAWQRGEMLGPAL